MLDPSELDAWQGEGWADEVRRVEPPREWPIPASPSKRPTPHDYNRAPEALAFATGASAGFLTGLLVAVVLFLAFAGMR